MSEHLRVENELVTAILAALGEEVDQATVKRIVAKYWQLMLVFLPEEEQRLMRCLLTEATPELCGGMLASSKLRRKVQELIGCNAQWFTLRYLSARDLMAAMVLVVNQQPAHLGFEHLAWSVLRLPHGLKSSAQQLACLTIGELMKRRLASNPIVFSRYSLLKRFYGAVESLETPA